jgi:molybdate transport system regulatory protein
MSAHLQPHLRVDVIEGNRLLFGDSDVRLLDAIAREGTLTDGAAALGLSYRVAWGRLRAFEAGLGERLLETTVGGTGGGSSRLTPAAQRLVARYNAFRDAVGAFTLQEFEKHFGDAVDCSKLCLEEPDTDLDQPEIPASLLRETLATSGASGELV